MRLLPVWLVSVVLIALPFVGEAQPRPAPRVGLLSDESASGSSVPISLGAFSKALRDLGWIEGQNFTLERRYAAGKNEILPDLATELVRLKVDVIVTFGTSATMAAKKATETIPIVFARVGDPVGFGFVRTLSRPEGNLTGVTIISRELSATRLALLKETVPSVRRVGVLWDPSFLPAAPESREVEGAARSLRMDLQVKGVQRPEEFEGALAAMTRQHVSALMVLPGLVFTENRKRLADLAVTSRLPTMFMRREMVEAGGLVSYRPDFAENYRRASTYVDRLLRGAKPADLPVEQPTRVELILNARTARALGLSIPPSVLVRADQVIE